MNPRDREDGEEESGGQERGQGEKKRKAANDIRCLRGERILSFSIVRRDLSHRVTYRIRARERLVNLEKGALPCSPMSPTESFAMVATLIEKCR